MIHIHDISLPTDVVVIPTSPELGPPDYTVPEDIGTFQVCLNMTQPPPDVPFEKTFDIMVTSAEGTAGMSH